MSSGPCSSGHAASSEPPTEKSDNESLAPSTWPSSNLGSRSSRANTLPAYNSSGSNQAEILHSRNQQTVFIVMGLMHPLALLIFWWRRLRGRLEQVDLARGPDMASHDPTLVIAGLVISANGGILLALISANWQLCMQAATPAVAAQAATAAGGVCVVGLALVYAGMPQRVTA